jgi:hypothetical protein
MMYQRLAMVFIRATRSLKDSEHRRDREADHLIGDKKKHGGGG